ncbi:MFS transporter [Microbacterium sp. bgisy207]|uniref:MFS transporter n=1 Tax=Microbacterium sp. bgisy207 TaxID=3413800 RepID=UPI003EB6A329
MTTPTSPAPTTPATRRWWTLGTVAIAQLMVVLDATVVNIALPAAQADLGFSDGDRQWVVTAYSLAFGSLLLLGGRLSDLIGRKLAFLIGLIGFAVASLLGGLAGSFEMLVAARALQGVFAALLAPTALAVLTTTFTIPRERSRAFGVFGAIAGAGGAVGLLLGGFLTEQFDWRWNLTINVFFAAIAFVLALVFVPAASRQGPRPQLDIPGTLLASAGLFALVFGFSRAESDGWDAPLTWGSLVAAAVLLVGFVVWQRVTAHPLLPLPVVVDRNRGASFISVMITGAGMFGVFLFVTYYFQLTLAYTPMQTGVGFLPMIVMLVFAAQLSTNVLLPRLGPKILVPTGMLLAAAAMILFTRLGTDSTYLDALAPLLVLGYGMGTIMPAAIQTATLGVDRRYAGVSSAMVNTSQQVGGSIGTALLNTLAATALADYVAANQPVSDTVLADAAVHSYTVAYWWSAAFFIVGAVIAAVLFRRKRFSVASAFHSETAESPALAH